MPRTQRLRQARPTTARRRNALLRRNPGELPTQPGRDGTVRRPARPLPTHARTHARTHNADATDEDELPRLVGSARANLPTPDMRTRTRTQARAHLRTSVGGGVYCVGWRAQGSASAADRGRDGEDRSSWDIEQSAGL